MAPSRAMKPLQSICASCAKQAAIRRHFTTTPYLRYADSSPLPRVATPTFWSSLIPKPLRRTNDPVQAAEMAKIKASRSKEWNPATIFIILGILVGSNAIQIIALRNETLAFSRKTDAKLSLLREVIQRVKNGEDVDVKKALGTGDEMQEAEWEEVAKELESTDMLWEGRKKRESRRAERAAEVKAREAAREGGSGQAVDVEERRPKFLM